MQKITENDIVEDIMNRVATLAKGADKITMAHIDALNKKVRADWGGDTVYISKRAGEGTSERNTRIYRDYLRGERVAFLARKYGLDPSTVSRAVAGMKEKNTA
jgi:Mor family transcriptional regulator